MRLDNIVANKRAELKEVISARPLSILEHALDALPARRDFTGALKGQGTRIIAELKKASPSRGVIREDFDPVEIAGIYETSGASAISVLTESRYFMGSLDYLTQVRAKVGIPILRKDFLFDYYQLVEAKVAGADAVLLIVAILDDSLLRELILGATELGLATLVEVHSAGEVERALKVDARIIGVNNRDLATFETNIETTKDLIPLVGEGRVIVSESAIETRDDIVSLTKAGADAFLIGEALLRQADITGKLKDMIGAF